MEFKQLESFRAVVKYQSFTRAAKSLYISQPTISSHIRELEEELDVELELDEKISTVGEMVKLVEEKMSEKE